MLRQSLTPLSSTLKSRAILVRSSSPYHMTLSSRGPIALHLILTRTPPYLPTCSQTRAYAHSPPPKPASGSSTPTSLPPNPPGTMVSPGQGKSMAVPTLAAVAAAVGAYMFFSEKEQQVTGGDITKVSS